MTTGQKINELRRKNGMTQEELAERLGVTRQAVSKWEQDLAFPETEKILQLCQLFHMSADELLLGDRAREAERVCLEESQVLTPSRRHFEYVSKTRLFGLPLVHINVGAGLYRAKGIVAIGNVATGLIAIGGLSVGILAIGGIALGLLFVLGGLSLGALAIGGVALGGIAVGGVAIGLVSVGGLAVGWFAIGGFSVGQISLGGIAEGWLAVGRYDAIGEHAFLPKEDGAIDALREFAEANLSPFWARLVMAIARNLGA